MKKVLIFLTNHGTLGDTDEANGTFSPELTHALDVFLKADVYYDLAYIKGAKAPLYGTDIEDDKINASILANEEFQNRINNTLVASKVNIDDYDGIAYMHVCTHINTHGHISTHAVHMHAYTPCIYKPCICKCKYVRI